MQSNDIIRLLPDAVANQIAAGEVIQRPASAVKELLENAIDAKATQIKMIIKDAGKSLIRVIDNGKGMSVNDARLCFERHATSKLKEADDLFRLNTKGFRGEALAAIAGVAQVELITRREEDELATRVEIEGSKIKSQEPIAANTGTSISVKNLFFNIPARRNFLKPNQVETRHIMEEFYRVALIHPEVAFQLFLNTDEPFLQLEKSTYKERIIAISGNSYREKLVPVEEKTEFVTISGFVVKPEFSRKTRGEQYFFVNGRFIKSSYLHHAITNAFEEILPSESHPSYYIKIDLSPAAIDINIHPTKTEIKFEDEKMIYSILRAAVKRTLGVHQIAPSLDFTQEQILTFNPSNRDFSPPPISVNRNYNPFDTAQQLPKKSPVTDWQKLFEGFEAKNPVETEAESATLFASNVDNPEEVKIEQVYWQLHKKYVFTPVRSGFLVIDQQRAHERILFERYLEMFTSSDVSSQQVLFPHTLDLNPIEMSAFNEMRPMLNRTGFEIEDFGKQSLIIRGVPASISDQQVTDVLMKMIAEFLDEKNPEENLREKVAFSMAKATSIKYGRVLNIQEMNNLADELFACEKPYISPSGLASVITIGLDELDGRFR